jgi:hypothetical protein
MKYAVEMATGGMIHLRNFMKIGCGIHVILQLFPLTI